MLYRGVGIDILVNMKSKCVVAIVVTGMPGSGKSIFSEVARELGLEVYVMGDAVRRELLNKGLPITRENMAMAAIELRRTYGEDIVARMIVDDVISSHRDWEGCRYIVIDGSRSLKELEVFRKSFSEVIVIGIHASPKTRFARLYSRGREGDPKSWEEFVARDSLELSIGLGEVLALADIMIVNDQIEIDEFKRKATEVLKSIVERSPGQGDAAPR